MVYEGNIGLGLKQDFTILGNTVNLASRIEQLTKQHGTAVLASETTRRLAGDGFDWTAAPAVPVKGKAAPVETFIPGFARPASSEASSSSGHPAGP